MKEKICNAYNLRPGMKFIGPRELWIKVESVRNTGKGVVIVGVDGWGEERTIRYSNDKLVHVVESR